MKESISVVRGNTAVVPEWNKGSIARFAKVCSEPGPEGTFTPTDPAHPSCAASGWKRHASVVGRHSCKHK